MFHETITRVDSFEFSSTGNSRFWEADDELAESLKRCPSEEGELTVRWTGEVEFEEADLICDIRIRVDEVDQEGVDEDALLVELRERLEWLVYQQFVL